MQTHISQQNTPYFTYFLYMHKKHNEKTMYIKNKQKFYIKQTQINRFIETFISNVRQ